MPDNNLASPAELFADLGISTATPSTSTTKGKSFLTRQFTLFSTPYLTVYLQGVLPTLANAITEEDQLTEAFSLAVSRRLGRTLAANPHLEEAVSLIAQNVDSLYTDKAKHIELIKGLVGAGGMLDKEKVANRLYPLAAINEYLTALAEYITSLGYESLEDYLATHSRGPKQATSALSLEQLQDIWDEL